MLDLALIGGGLQNGLIALATLAARPSARIAIFERADGLGGNHTWCFHDGDVAAADAAVLDPLVVARWRGHDVAFPRYRRTLTGGYAAIASTRFDEVVRARLAAAPRAAVHTGCAVVAVRPHEVFVRDGDRVVRHQAITVVDARGPSSDDAGAGGFQKFVGQEVRLAAPHGLTRPMLMDATVEQRGGFRFLYVLPLADDRLLIEDTCYADDAGLDRPALRAAIAAYAADHGWTIAAVEREEEGVLPLPWAGDVTAPRRGLIVGGYRGGWFHPVTGYSLPVAMRVARAIADAIADERDPAQAVGALVPDHRAQLALAHRLNWMMFRWFQPERRHGVLEHFYRLPEDAIGRFYALTFRRRDRARLFVGRPPRGLSWRAVLTAGPPRGAAPARAPEAP